MEETNHDNLQNFRHQVGDNKSHKGVESYNIIMHK